MVFFSCSGRRLMRPDHGAVDGEQAPVDLTIVDLACLQPTQDPIPQAFAAPFAKAVVHSLPRPESLGHITPATAIREDPENGVEHHPVFFPLAAPLSVLRQQVLDLLPLIIGELVGRRHDGHLALLGN